MKQTVFSELAHRLYGPSGQYWPEFGKLEEVWRCSFLDHYPQGELAAESSVQRYCGGYSRPPRWMRERYALEDGLNVLIKNMNFVVGCSCSLQRVRTIQQGVHNWLEEAALEVLDMDEINRRFVPEEASWEEVANYFATVMHQVILTA